MNGTAANQIGIAWEQLEVLYHANDADATD